MAGAGENGDPAETMAPEASAAEEAAVPSADMLSALGAAVEEVRAMVAERVRYDDLKERMFSALHEELKGYRDEALRQAQRPLIADLLLLHDRICREADGCPAETTPVLERLLQDVTDALYRANVEPLPETPRVFDRTVQKAVRAETTHDESENLVVLRVVRKGFAWNGKLLRPEEVIVLRYEPEPEGIPSGEAPSSGKGEGG